MEVRRIHGVRGPQTGAGGAARLFQRWILQLVSSPCNCRLVLVTRMACPATRTTARTATRGPAYRRPSAGPAGPATSRPCSEADGRHSVRITRAPTQWCRRAYGRTAGAVRARRLPGASQRSRTPDASCGRWIRRLWACTSISMIVVNFSPGHIRRAAAATHARLGWRRVHCRKSFLQRRPRLAPMAAHPGLLAAAARRMRLGLLLTPAAVQRLRQYRPARANLGQRPSPAPPCAAAIPATTCATARWPWTASWACPGGAAIAVERLAQLTAQPRVLLAQVPDLHTQRHHRATLSGSTWVAASNFVRRCTSACRDNASFAVRRIASVSLRASISAIGFEQSLATNCPSCARQIAWRHWTGAGYRHRARHLLIANTTRARPPRSLAAGSYQASGSDPCSAHRSYVDCHDPVHKQYDHARNDSAIPACQTLRTDWFFYAHPSAQ